MRCLKICFTSNSSPWSKFHGGGQIFIHNLAKNLGKMGHRVTVIYAGADSREFKNQPEPDYKKEFVRYIGYPWTCKFRQLNSVTVYRKLKYLHKSQNFDIINSLGGEALFIPKLCREDGIPFFVSIEHPSLQSIRPYINWKHPVQSLMNIARSRELWICRHACHHARFIFSPSIFTKDQVVQFFKIRPQKIRIVNHGIDDAMLCGVDLPGTRGRKGPWVFFGRLEPQKGVDLLIKAYFKLVNHKFISDQKLIIIGNGPYQKKYQNLARRLGLKNRIQFKGWKPPAYIKRQLSMASLCILPSRSESFGLSMAETLSQNVPLITTSAGSIPEVVDFGKGAWLTKPDDVDSLSNTISNAIEKYPESLLKAAYGRKYVLENFTWEKAAREYEKIYLDVLNGK